MNLKTSWKNKMVEHSKATQHINKKSSKRGRNLEYANLTWAKLSHAFMGCADLSGAELPEGVIHEKTK